MMVVSMNILVEVYLFALLVTPLSSTSKANLFLIIKYVYKVQCNYIYRLLIALLARWDLRRRAEGNIPLITK